MRLILASASPRRAELLTSAGFQFEVSPADVDETPKPSESPTTYALRVALDKALAVGARRRDVDGVVLSADTVVVASMLRLLANTVHDVHTAVVIRAPAGERAEVVTTRVTFLPLDDEEIASYVASGEPEGKAGAYAIQGRAARFVDRIEGSWSNVVGLPLATVYRLLKEVSDVD